MDWKSTEFCAFIEIWGILKINKNKNKIKKVEVSQFQKPLKKINFNMSRYGDQSRLSPLWQSVLREAKIAEATLVAVRWRRQWLHQKKSSLFLRVRKLTFFRENELLSDSVFPWKRNQKGHFHSVKYQIIAQFIFQKISWKQLKMLSGKTEHFPKI